MGIMAKDGSVEYYRRRRDGLCEEARRAKIALPELMGGEFQKQQLIESLVRRAREANWDAMGVSIDRGIKVTTG